MTANGKARITPTRTGESTEEKKNKLAALASGMPEMMVSSNIGCQSHLAEGAKVRVTQWIVALEERLSAGEQSKK